MKRPETSSRNDSMTRLNGSNGPVPDAKAGHLAEVGQILRDQQRIVRQRDGRDSQPRSASYPMAQWRHDESLHQCAHRTATILAAQRGLTSTTTKLEFQ